MASQLSSQHIVNQLELKVQQLEKDISELNNNRESLQQALEDKSRQTDNWKMMYECCEMKGCSQSDSYVVGSCITT